MLRRRYFLILFAVSLLTLFIFAGCGRADKDRTPKESNKPPIEDSQKENGNVALDQAPNFSLMDIKGEEITLSDYRGKPVILTFWVSWSEYSLNQLDIIENVYPLLKEDVIFLAINSTPFEQKDEEEIIRYLNNKNLSYKFLLDKEGTVSKDYYVGSFPTNFFIDRDGNSVKMFTTKIEEDRLLDEIELILSH